MEIKMVYCFGATVTRILYPAINYQLSPHEWNYDHIIFRWPNCSCQHAHEICLFKSYTNGWECEHKYVSLCTN